MTPIVGNQFCQSRLSCWNANETTTFLVQLYGVLSGICAMPQPFSEWKVLPHGKLTAIEDNMLTVVGEIPMAVGDMERRMTVVRLRDGRLVVFSAVALDEEEMRALEEFGAPAFLIVPNDPHRLDSKIWKDRYPGMRVIAPKGSREKT